MCTSQEAARSSERSREGVASRDYKHLALRGENPVSLCLTVGPRPLLIVKFQVSGIQIRSFLRFVELNLLRYIEAKRTKRLWTASENMPFRCTPLNRK